MKNIIIMAILLALPLQLSADWLDDVTAIHAEIQSLTANEQELMANSAWSDITN